MSIKLNNYITTVMQLAPKSRAALWAVCSNIARPLPDVYLEIAELHQQFNDMTTDERISVLNRMVSIVTKVAKNLAQDYATHTAVSAPRYRKKARKKAVRTKARRL